MIRADATPGGVRFSGRLPDRHVAFIDADWFAECGTTDVLPLLWSAGRLLRDAAAVDVLSDVDGATAALAAFREVAAQVVQVIPPAARAATVIAGRGITAFLTRQHISPDRAHKDDRAENWIDFTGDADELTTAFSAVIDLGTVVLAGEREDDPGPLNLYPDVHARSLRLVGAAPVLATETVSYSSAVSVPPVKVELGDRARPGLWYEIHPGPDSRGSAATS